LAKDNGLTRRKGPHNRGQSIFCPIATADDIAGTGDPRPMGSAPSKRKNAARRRQRSAQPLLLL
jgi:hypothetical protein